MWEEDDTVRAPEHAQLGAQRRREISSQGNDDYLHQPSSNHSESILSHDDAASVRTTSTAHLTGQAMGRTGDNDAVANKDELDHSATTQTAHEDSLDQRMRAGQPIGFLAALGTKYAKKPIYRSRKCRILCPLLGGITTIITIIITLFPVLRAVAVHTLSTSVMAISGSNITRPTNNQFGLTLEGQVHKVGIFPAQLYFERPVRVYWIAPENLTEELELGQFALARIGVAAGHGRIKQQTVFNITNEPAFARFTEYLITQEEFTWRLKSEHVQAKAFSFIAVNNLVFIKDLTLPGMANMTDVSISDFQLPGDDPAGGISLAVSTKFTNPSAFGVEIGILAVDLYYEDLYLGPAQTSSPINLTSGVNSVNLVGRMLPYGNDTAALAKLSTVFSNYLNGVITPVKAVGRSVTLPNGDQIDWLTKGIKALVLNVPLQSPTGRISPIKTITIKELSLGFDDQHPYAPTANSSQIEATFGLPFGFSLDIAKLQTSFTIVDNKTAITSLAGPFGLSKTAILTRNAGFTTGSLELDLPIARLVTPPSYTDHLIFDQFNYDFTTTSGANFILVGNTSVVTDTPIGQVLLTNIGFTVPAGLIGLDGLKTFPTNIISVDVMGGTKDAVILAIDVGLTNPSNLDLSVGDVTFQLFNGDSFLGTTVLPALHLTPGYQVHTSTGYFQANNNPVALSTFTNYAQGLDAQLKISGFNGSSTTTSLTQAFMAIHLNTTLTGLQTKLLNYANLTILPTTGVTNNFANSVVSLSNPFTSVLDITNIQSNITAHGFFVGSISQDTAFTATGKGASLSPVLNFNLNLFPPDIFALLRTLALQAGLDVAPLDGVVAIGGLKYSTPSTNSTTKPAKRMLSDEQQLLADMLVAPSKMAGPGQDESEHMFSPDKMEYVTNQQSVPNLDYLPDPFANNTMTPTFAKRNSIVKRNIYTGFDLPTFVLASFAPLTVDIELVSVLRIGEFQTNLAYHQAGVAAHTDSSLTLLLPILARPIVQKIVDGSILGVSTVMITNPTNAAFTTGLVGSITNAGPFDAVIGFPTGLTVAWNGAPLGQIAMPNVALVADLGASLNIEANFVVANLAHLTDFTGYLLTEPSFTWQIYGTNLSVTALGITVGGISISKNVVLDGMNGFKGLVTIETFDLPANDPAGGVALTLQTSLTNPSSVGVALSTIGFANSFGATTIGPASSTGPFSLLPKATIQLPLAGRLIPQTTPQGLADVSTIFNGFIHGVPSDLIVAGTNAGPAECTWLNEGIKKLSIAVVLPAAVNLQVINSITINQVTLMFTESTGYAPGFSTSNTVAKFQLPFAFPVDITNAQTAITAADVKSVSGLAKRDTGDFATLNVPMLPSTTDVVARTLLLTFANIPFTSINDGTFSSYLRDVTDGTSKDFGLHGSATTITSTAIGSLLLSDIPFNVETNLLGLQGLNAKPAIVSNLDVFHGYPGYLQINADAALFNPSNITIGTGDVSFGLQFMGTIIGSAQITGLVLVPGDNLVPTAVHYQPSGSATAVGQVLLENFVQGIVSDTLIVGSSSTTPIKSLQEALGSIQLATTIPPLHQNLIIQAALVFPLDIAKDGQGGIAASTFNLANPFTASINLLSVKAVATYQGIPLGTIDVKNLSPPINAPGHTLITSPSLPIAVNVDPKALASFLIAAAAAQGVDLGPLTAPFAFVLSLASTESKIQSSVNLEPETCTPTGSTKAVQAIILAAVRNLKTDLTISSLTKLDDYQTPLDFVQKGVPTVLDSTVLYLTGILGKTIVQNIVDGSALAFASGEITQVTDTGFTVALKGSLLNAGPFDALIEFPGGVTVIWQGSKIATIALPAICSSANSGVPALVTTGVLTITDLSRFTDFATYILHNPGFTWTITTPTVRVSALGTIFNDVQLSKDISFTAFNGLPGVAIVNPNFPGDSGTSILLETQSTIPSPSNLGIDLGTVSFIAAFQGQEVGPISGSGLILEPLTTTTIELHGTIIKRTSQASTDSLGVLFSGFLAGKNQTLQVTGDSVVSPAQPNSPVVWLTKAFKTLTLDVVLPGKQYEIISAIQLQDLTVTIDRDSESYAPLVRNNETDVVYKNPFGFSLTTLEAGGAFYIEYQNTDAALLTLPQAKAVSAQTSTGQNANLVINFPTDQVLVAQDHSAFQNFFAAVTVTPSAAFVLHGVANVLAGTVVGSLEITGIPFRVNTAFKGINAFGGVAVIPATPTVAGGGNPGPGNDQFHPVPGSEFLIITLDVILSNPAPLILHTNLVSFQVIYRDVVVGRAYINPLDLYRDSNTIPSAFHYEPAPANSPIAQDLLTQYLSTKGQIPLTIQGDVGSSPYGALQGALAATKLQTSFPGQGFPLISDIMIYFDPVVAFCGGYVSISTRIFNNLPVELQITHLQVTASQGGVQYAHFDFTFPAGQPFVAPKLDGKPGTASPSPYTTMISPVFLDKGALGSAPLLTASPQTLDIQIVSSTVSIGGYVAPSFKYFQAGVPYVINPTLAGLSLSTASIGSIPSAPSLSLGTLTSVLSELTSLTTCSPAFPDSPLLNPGLVGAALSKLPAAITSLIRGADSILAPITSAVLAPLSSALAPLVSPVTSALAPALTPAASVASKVVATLPSAVTAALPLPKIIKKRDDETPAAIPLPTQDFKALNNFLAFDQTESAVAPQPTAAPRSDKVAEEDHYYGVSPMAMQALLERHGLEVGEPVVQA